MSQTIVNKAKSILQGIESDFDLGFNWKDEYFDNYYRYFDDPDAEVRKWSLLIFAGGLGSWSLQSANIFSPDGEGWNEDKEYIFEDYVQAFLTHREAIKKEFPLLYNYLVWVLLYLDKRKPFDSIFTSYISYPSYISPNIKLFRELRQVLNSSGIDVNILPNNHQAIMKEVGLTPL
ncbi:hypothetical protein [Sporosarcina sp.]|uniref:hypothetical protein n=1 Tax=Sporosarcina sp. TaxID=49982 RepID=UPI00261411E7|nr:hypothetical protein [Sporosarcina sp.]